MGDLQNFLKDLDKPKNPEIAFGSKCPRRTIPVEKYTTKLSLVYITPTGRPNVGPGMYNVQDKFNCVYESGKKIANKRGYVLRTEPRFKRLYEIPNGKLDYMEQPKRIKAAAKPFGSGVPTFRPLMKPITDVPGPGTYDIAVTPKQKIKRLESFGGKVTTVSPVSVKCVPVPQDRCSKCEKKPFGVYYQSDTTILCRYCHGKLMANCAQMNPLKKSALCDAFKKVRDCSFCHNHQGTSAAVLTKSLTLLQRQQVLETYFNRYF